MSTTAWDACWSTTQDEKAPANQWMTPPDIALPLHREFSFGLDAAASSQGWHENYLGPDHVDPSRRDSFVADWEALAGAGRPVFLNPPYGRGIGRWMALAQRWGERMTVAVLVFARTDTAWWWRHVLGRDPSTGIPLGSVQQLLPGVAESSLCASEIRWKPGRIAFLDPATGEPRKDSKNRPTSAPAPSVVIIYRPGHTDVWPKNGVFL